MEQEEELKRLQSPRSIMKDKGTGIKKLEFSRSINRDLTRKMAPADISEALRIAAAIPF